MAVTKRQKIIYWAVTILFLLPLAGSGIPELFLGKPDGTAATLTHLGYPLYLMRILGFAKLLGAAAVLSNRSRTLKEWAYAGFSFDLLGAMASHLIVGDGAFAAVPGVILVLVLVSHRLWQRMRIET